uniref:Serine hydrolase n=1 Tax=Loa loa TaxID=7209 RepID=A0A1I7VB40_LOALO
MARLIVYIAFAIYCQAANQNPARNVAPPARADAAGLGAVAAEIITDYKADELWEDGRLIATTKVNKSILMNCGTVEDGRLFILEEKQFTAKITSPI